MLCHYMEDEIQEIKAYRKNKFNNYELMLSKKDNNESLGCIDELIPYYERFLQIRAKDIIEQEEINNTAYGLDISSLKSAMIKKYFIQ